MVVVRDFGERAVQDTSFFQGLSVLEQERLNSRGTCFMRSQMKDNPCHAQVSFPYFHHRFGIGIFTPARKVFTVSPSWTRFWLRLKSAVSTSRDTGTLRSEGLHFVLCGGCCRFHRGHEMAQNPPMDILSGQKDIPEKGPEPNKIMMYAAPIRKNTPPSSPPNAGAGMQKGQSIPLQNTLASWFPTSKRLP